MTEKLEAMLAALPPTTQEALREHIREEEQRIRLEAHQEGRFRSQQFLETIPHSVLVIDSKSQVQYVNNTALEFFGITPAANRTERVTQMEQTYRYAQSLLQPEDLDFIRQVLAGKEDRVRETTVLCQGERRQIMLRAAPVRSSAGDIIYTAITFSDVTKIKQLEAELYQAQKMEIIGKLAGGIAHDFNNILTSIVGNTAFVLEKVGDRPEVYADALEIEKAAKLGTGLVGQLMLFSRRRVFHVENLDLNSVVAGDARMAERLVGSDYYMHTDLDPSLPPVRADKERVSQALLNLVVNARDAMPEGGTIRITTRQYYYNQEVAAAHNIEPGWYSALCVHDTGHGIPLEIQANIFEPFFTTKGEGKGTGLGLSTVYGIMKQHGGCVRVESAPTKGTTMQLYFPITHEPHEENAAQESEQTYTFTEHQRNGIENILLVDDTESVRTLMARILQRRGYQVREASSPTEALELGSEYGSGELDLIVSDVTMQGMYGPELVEKLQAIHPEARALYVSGNPRDDSSPAQHLLIDKEVTYLEKPFTPKDLIDHVRAVLNGEQRS